MKLVLFSFRKAWRITQVLMVVGILFTLIPQVWDMTKDTPVGKAIRFWRGANDSVTLKCDTAHAESLESEIAARKVQLDTDMAEGAMKLGAVSGDDYTALKTELDRSFASQREAIGCLKEELEKVRKSEISGLLWKLSIQKKEAADAQRKTVQDLSHSLASAHSKMSEDAETSSKNAAVANESEAVEYLATHTAEVVKLTALKQKLDDAARKNAFPAQFDGIVVGREDVARMRREVQARLDSESKMVADLVTKRDEARRELQGGEDPAAGPANGAVTIDDLLRRNKK